MKPYISKRIETNSPYTFEEVRKKVASLQSQGVEVIDFGVGDPSSPTPDFVIECLCSAAHSRASSGYPSYIGEKEFREAAAHYMKRDFYVDLDADSEITSTLGSKEAIFNFPLGFVDTGDIVICPTPGYPPYKNGTKFAGGDPYFVSLLPSNNFLIDIDAIPEEICKKARLIWVNYPNSPTGKTAPIEWYKKLVLWAKKHNIIIAADEGCYIDIYFDRKPHSILEVSKEGVVVFYSLSKRNNMTGYRVGFCAGDSQIIDIFKKVKMNIDSGTPKFIQDAAIAALNDTSHVSLMREEYAYKRKILGDKLVDIGLLDCKSDATFYIWQEAPKEMNGLEFAQLLIDQGIVVTPGEWLSDVTESGLNPGKNYVRFALVPPIEQVEDAVVRLDGMKF